MRFFHRNPIRPRNERVTEVARESVNRLIQVQKAQNVNAIRPDGRDALIYIPLIQGVRCTCSHRPELLDENGDMSAEGISGILSGQDSNYGFSDYGVSDAVSMSVSEIGIVDNLDDPDPSPVLQAALSGELPLGLSTVACAVCFGRGFVGGFRLANGLRLVMDAQTISDFGGAMLSESRPLSFLNPARNVVSVNVTLPLAGVRVDALRLWNNDEPVACALFYLDDVPATASNFLSLVTGAPQRLSFTTTLDATVTHLELQIGYANVQVDVSSYVNTTNNQTFRQIGDIQIVIPPTVFGDFKGGIVAEGTDGYVYHMLDLNSNENYLQDTITNSVNARIVNPYELTYLLPRFGSVIQTGQRRQLGARGNTPRRSLI